MAKFQPWPRTGLVKNLFLLWAARPALYSPQQSATISNNQQQWQLGPVLSCDRLCLRTAFPPWAPAEHPHNPAPIHTFRPFLSPNSPCLHNLSPFTLPAHCTWSWTAYGYIETVSDGTATHRSDSTRQRGSTRALSQIVAATRESVRCKRNHAGTV